jgi:hypothetical protein
MDLQSIPLGILAEAWPVNPSTFPVLNIEHINNPKTTAKTTCIKLSPFGNKDLLDDLLDDLLPIYILV